MESRNDLKSKYEVIKEAESDLKMDVRKLAKTFSVGRLILWLLCHLKLCQHGTSTARHN